MANIVSSSLATGVGAGVQNVTFSPQAENVPRKQVIIGTYEAGKTITDEVPVISLSPENTASVYGFGSMLHRLHLQNDRGAGGIETWIQPQAEAGGAVAAAGEIDYTVSGAVAGTLALYIGFDRVPITVTDSMTEEELADATVAAINDDENLPVTAAKVAVTFEVTVTAKTKGTWGDDIVIDFNLQPTDKEVTGVSWAITQPTGGSGLPDIQDALDGLGVGDAANQEQFTALIHGYGQDSTTLNDIRSYVGATDELLGLYSETVARPFYSLVGDTAAGSSGLTTLLSFTGGRKTDRASGVIAAPGSNSHPMEIAAQVIGHIERKANEITAQHYADTELISIHVGDTADRWTNDYDDRDTAVKGGIGTTFAQGQSIVIKDTITMSRPDSIPVTSNAYREITNIVKIQNMLDSVVTLFSSSSWQGVYIVADTNKISSAIDKTKARDVLSVRTALGSLINSWAAKGWIYTETFSLENLEVEVRPGADGFNSVIPSILSGLGKIFDNLIQVDTSIAALA